MFLLCPWHYDSLGIDFNHLIEDMVVDDSFLYLNLMDHIECSLNVSQLGTSLQHSYVSVLIWLDILGMHHMPKLNCLVSVRMMRCAGHHNRVVRLRVLNEPIELQIVEELHGTFRLLDL